MEASPSERSSVAISLISSPISPAQTRSINSGRTVSLPMSPRIASAVARSDSGRSAFFTMRISPSTQGSPTLTTRLYSGSGRPISRLSYSSSSLIRSFGSL